MIVALDHGRRLGPLPGIEDLRHIVGKVIKGGADALMMTPAMINVVYPEIIGRVGVIARIDGGSTILGANPTDERLTSSVMRAFSLAADAVAVNGYVGVRNESRSISKLGRIADVCESFGVPLLAEMRPGGPKVKDPHDVPFVKIAARVGAEFGADIVKTYYTGDLQSFKEVTDSCPVPIVILGGPKMESVEELLEMVYEAIKAGARGVAMGRNLWQHKNPTAMTRAVSKIVHENASVNEALTEI